MDNTLVRNNPEYLQIVMPVITGVFCGTILFLDIPMKWKLTFLMAFGFALLLLMLRDGKHVLLFTLAFAIPLYIGKDFISRPEHIGLVRVVGVYLTDALVIALLFLFLIRLTVGQARLRLYPWITLPALLWLAASGYTLVNAREPELAAIQLTAMTKLFVCYIVVANSVEDTEDLKWIMRGLLLGLLLQGILGSYQGIAGRPLGLSTLGETKEIDHMMIGQNLANRPRGTVGHPNCYAMYIVTVIPFGFAMMFTRMRLFWKFMIGAVLIISVLGLIFSLSRGGWISLAVVTCVVLVSAIRRQRIEGRMVFIVTLSILLILLAVFSIGSNTVISRFTSSDHGSAYSRITMAKGALAMLRDYPFTGVGLNNYTLFMPGYDWATVIANGGPMVVHNIFLLIAAETGLIGLIAFMMFLVALMRRAWQITGRALDETQWIAGVGILSAFISLTLHGMVDFALLWDLTLFTQFWFMAGVTAGLWGQCVMNRELDDTSLVNRLTPKFDRSHPIIRQYR